MFSWGGNLALPSITIDATRERSPPPPPTRLQFPDYVPSGSGLPPTEARWETLYQLLSKLKRAQDVTEAHLAALNVKVEKDVKIEDILPGNRLPSLPPYEWPEETPTAEGAPSGSTSRLSNGYTVPDKKRYELLRKELLYDNSDGFRAAGRVPPLPGRAAVTLTYSRKFWAALEHVSQYWDTSLDRYFEKPLNELPTPKGEEGWLEKMEVENAVLLGDKMDADVSHSTEKSNTAEEEGSGQPKTKRLYTGRRISSGQDMPEGMREDLIRGFVEMVSWAFSCHVRFPNLPPRLLVKRMLFPVRQSFTLCRTPLDRASAKRGTLEGPLLVVQCRAETVFKDPSGNSNGSRYLEICDLLRETIAMLLLAQERSREGMTETKPGEGKWWATEPRWGGASNGGDIEGSNNSSPESNGNGVTKRSRHSRKGAGQRKLTMADRWKLVQPGPSLWEKNMNYIQVGRDRDSAFDDIFMISSVNHHFSVLHLAVHPQYLEGLVSGKTTSDNTPIDAEHPWHSLVLRRTRWYDLFNAEDRAEALDGLWALFSWLMR